ncbi:MAG: TetR/AcrR family transcriptional regulator [Acidimicrobiia bacterium]|nr:MAG: TetR/AcrR family transcriptional regulator [Acidimicrobiia bacterium]
MGTQEIPVQNGEQRTKQMRGDAATEAILRATHDLIVDEGYTNLTIDAVATRAGVARSTIYRRWANKQALVVDAARIELRELEIPDIGSFREEIRMYMMGRLSWFLNDESTKATEASLAALAEDPSTEAAFGARTEALITPVVEAAERAKARGEIRQDVDISALKGIIAGPLTFTANYLRITPDLRLVDAVVDIICRGVAPDDDSV